jgi:branched-chain amino acid transport system substrate-binding protein
MFSSVAGVPADQLTGAGKEFVDSFMAETGAEPPLEPYTAYAAQATEVLLAAIDSAATAERGPIVEALFTTSIEDGILGSFELNENGDPSVGPVTIYVAADSFGTHEVITPEPDLVEAAKAS